MHIMLKEMWWKRFFFAWSIFIKEYCKSVKNIFFKATEPFLSLLTNMSEHEWTQVHSVCHQIMFIYISTQKYKCNFRNYDETLTHPFSTRLLIKTMMQMFCSHIILQKSSMLDLTGPWAAMYNRGFLKPWETQSADMIFGKSECHRCMCKMY